MNLSTPGRKPDPGSIEALSGKIDALSLPDNCIIIFDLLGNACYRYANFEGTALPPIKSGKGYHFPGNIVTFDYGVLRRLVILLRPVFEKHPRTLKIIISPLPRYLLVSCCVDPTHGPNVGGAGFARHMLGKVEHTGTVIKGELTKVGLRNAVVANSIELISAYHTAHEQHA